MISRFYPALVTLAFGVHVASPALAQDKTLPFIPGYNRFYLDAKGDDAVHGGQLLLGELGCVHCHQAPADLSSAVFLKKAPILDGIGSRVKKTFFKKFLLDPPATKPHTNMPDVLATLPAEERENAAEALAHFLASTGAPSHEKATPKAIAIGKTLYEQVGCVACHGTRGGRAEQLSISATSVPLGDLLAKYTIPSLSGFLANPHAVRPSGRMPGLLSDKEARDVAGYLLQGVGVDLAKANMKFFCYEGAWNVLPDFDKLTPKFSGVAEAFSIGIASRPTNIGLKYEGYLKIEKEGQYKFWLSSDDGSKLWVDDKLVVNNDGEHATTTVTGSTFLTKGMRLVRVSWFNHGGPGELKVEVQGGGLSKQPLGPLIQATDKPPEVVKVVKDKDDFAIDRTLVAKGRTLFARIGCANCHQLQDGGAVIASALEPPPLVRLQEGEGCLSEKPGAKAPRYVLPAKARQDIEAALDRVKGGKAPKADLIHRTFVAFNCYACHERDKRGGPEETWNKQFTTSQPEMGDEARIPPSLTGVGAKMQTAYLKHIFTSGADDRPYMHTRMPKYGMDNVGHLIAEFQRADTLPSVEAVKFDVAAGKVKSEGRHMVGALSLGCIKCHTFNGNKAEGVQGMDMALMTKRVTRDWFHQYLLHPMKLRPGTRMPEAWPKGVSPLPKILDGDTAKQIEAIYVYLNDGKSALLPLGLKKQFIPLVADKEAIIYRNFIQGAGTRAIGVGYPEKANLAFDANDLRLALIWQGAFIDASRHWTDRGSGYEPPLGDNILSLPPGPSFATLLNFGEAWPAKSAKALGQQFKGYTLTKDQRPKFLYEVGGIRVGDFPNAVESKTGLPRLLRTLTLTAEDAAPTDLYFRAAMASTIEPLKEGWYQIGAWKMRLDTAGGAEPRIRANPGGQMEILVPIRFKDGRGRIVQEFEW